MTTASGLAGDLRIAARGLRRSPGFTAAAILTLALGVGASSAVFSVADAVLFRPLPYRDLARRVMIWSQWKGWDKTWVSEPELFDYRTRCRTVTDVAAWSSEQMNLTGSDADPIRIGVGRVTANLFRTLGAAPVLGRGFTDEEDRPGHDTVAVISFGLWQRWFGGDRRVLGESVRLDGHPYRVVGVMPQGFQLPTDFTEDAADPGQLWIPLAIDPAEIDRGSHGLYAAATLAPGATPASATEELHALTASLTREGLYPPVMQFRAFAVGLEQEILGSVRPAVLLLLGAVGFLLLIACANVASLLLARSETRHRDISVRAALGASRARLFRYALVESALLGVAGAGLGLLVAATVSRALAALGPVTIPRVGSVAIDLPVLAFTAGLLLVTTMLFGLAPALRAVRAAPADSLREAGTRTSAGGDRRHLRGLLVVVEMSLAIVLVIGAGLMIRSLQSLRRIDLGFRPGGVLTARLWLPQASYGTPESVIAFYHDLLERVRALPGVKAAGLVRSLPLAATIGDFGLDIEGRLADQDLRAKGDWQVATDGAAEALGERLIRGRLLDARDTTDAQQVAVINETMARTYWPGLDAIGQRFRLGRGQKDRPWVTVVGIVGDERHNGITAVVKEKFYRPHSQFHVSTHWVVRGMTLVVRADDPMRLAGPIKGIVRAMDRSLPVAAIRPMTEVVDASMATSRLTGMLLTLFAALAAVLAAVGIYGVLSYLVSQRTREIGIRLAIGASPWQVLRMVLRHGLVLAGAGLVTGLAAAAALTRLMARLLHGVRPLDPLTFALVTALLALVAAAASYVPARRATRVDPIRALRVE